MRIPEWTDQSQVACKVNRERRQFTWSRNYVEIGDLEQGDRVTVEFPMRKITVFRVTSRFPYKLTIKGNTVVDIDPEGKINPIYQRDKYKQDQAPMRKVTRFASPETLRW